MEIALFISFSILLCCRLLRHSITPSLRHPVTPSLHYSLTPLFLIAFGAHGAFEREPLSPTRIALGNACAAHGDAAVSETENPSSRDAAPWVALAYTQPFQVSGLAEQGIRAGMPLGSLLSLRFAFQRFGNELHSEDAYGMTAAVHLPRLSVGARGERLSRRTPGFRGADALSADIGAWGRLSPTVAVGGVVKRLNAPEIAPPREIRAGVRVELDAQSAFLADAARVGGETLTAFGGEWRPHPALTLRGGVHNRPWQWAGGFTLRWSAFALNYTMETHPALDATHVVGLTVGGTP